MNSRMRAKTRGGRDADKSKRPNMRFVAVRAVENQAELMPPSHARIAGGESHQNAGPALTVTARAQLVRVSSQQGSDIVSKRLLSMLSSSGLRDINISSLAGRF